MRLSSYSPRPSFCLNPFVADEVNRDQKVLYSDIACIVSFVLEEVAAYN
jgi:hypothetical protein